MDPDHGLVTKTGINYGSTATFSCDAGYGLIGGERVLTCGGDGTSLNGTWNSDPPSCQGRMCVCLCFSVVNKHLLCYFILCSCDML